MYLFNVIKKLITYHLNEIIIWNFNKNKFFLDYLVCEFLL